MPYQLDFIQHNAGQDRVEQIKEEGKLKNDALDKAFTQLGTTGELLNTLDANLSPATRALIESHYNAISDLAGDIAKNGWSSQSNNTLKKLIASYQKDIIPIANKWLAHTKKRDAENDVFAKDPTLQKVGKKLQDYGIDDVVFNEDIKGSRYVSGNELQKKAAKYMQNVVERTHWKHGSTWDVQSTIEQLGHQFMKNSRGHNSKEQAGIQYTNIGLNEFLKMYEENIPPTDANREYYTGVLETIEKIKAEYNLDEFTPEQQKQLEKSIVAGIWDGTTRKDESDATSTVTLTEMKDPKGSGKENEPALPDLLHLRHDTVDMIEEGDEDDIANKKVKAVTYHTLEGNDILLSPEQAKNRNFLNSLGFSEMEIMHMFQNKHENLRRQAAEGAKHGIRYEYLGAAIDEITPLPNGDLEVQNGNYKITIPFSSIKYKVNNKKSFLTVEDIKNQESINAQTRGAGASESPLFDKYKYAYDVESSKVDNIYNSFNGKKPGSIIKDDTKKEIKDSNKIVSEAYLPVIDVTNWDSNAVENVFSRITDNNGKARPEISWVKHIKKDGTYTPDYNKPIILDKNDKKNIKNMLNRKPRIVGLGGGAIGLQWDKDILAIPIEAMEIEEWSDMLKDKAHYEELINDIYRKLQEGQNKEDIRVFDSKTGAYLDYNMIKKYQRALEERQIIIGLNYLGLKPYDYINVLGKNKKEN